MKPQRGFRLSSVLDGLVYFLFIAHLRPFDILLVSGIHRFPGLKLFLAGGKLTLLSRSTFYGQSFLTSRAEEPIEIRSLLLLVINHLVIARVVLEN